LIEIILKLFIFIDIVEEQEEREWKNNTHSISVFLEQQNQGLLLKRRN